MNDPSPVRHDPAGHRFVLEADGHQAVASYRLLGDRMTIDHTLVPQAIGGRGLAGRLVQAAFDHARAEGWKVVPECSYARTWLERHPGYADLLAD